MKFLRSKKGFTLVECVVALALFAVITASVMTVFATSRNQIQKNNDQYKIDLTANNILAAYEGSNTSGSFKKRLNSIGLELNNTGTFSKTIGKEGTGQYSFDAQNIPVAQPFDKITVKDGAATFTNEGSTLVSFKGTYPDNKLQGNEDLSVSTLYNEAKDREPAKMELSGKAHDGSKEYDFSLLIDETNVTLKQFGAMKESISKPASDFDKYLLQKGYYLKCDFDRELETRWFIVTIPVNYHYRFQVYNAKDNTPVKDGGNYLYYCITIPVANALTCNADMAKVSTDKDNADSTYFNLDDCKVKFYTGTSCPSYDKFSSELKNDNGKTFGDKWYFMPWIVHTNEGNILPDCYKYTEGYDYYIYTAKDPEKSNINYVLDSTEVNECFVFNSNDDLIFTYENNSEEALKHLVDNCGFGIDDSNTGKKKRNTQALKDGKTYDKWYHKGAVPLWNVTRVKFTDGGAYGTSKIVFYGKADGAKTDSEYITFTYEKDNYENFKADRSSVLDLYGDYSEFYNYAIKYNAKTLKNITNQAELAPYKDKISGVTFGETTSTKTELYYTVSTTDLGKNKKPRYKHTYTYYSYNVATKTTVQLTGYKETSASLQIERNGDTVTCKETSAGTATVKEAYTYTITAKDSNKTTSSTDNTSGTPKTPPTALKNGKEVETLKKTHTEGKWPRQETITDWDYTSLSWMKENYSTGPASSTKTVDGIGTENTYTEIPANLDEIWTLTSTPSEAAVHTVAELTGLTGSGESYDVKVGENILFTAHPTGFSMTAGDVSADTTDCAYDIIGAELADIIAETYYISRTSGDVTLIAVATYSNYTKSFELEGVTQSQEPKITIWTMPKDKAPADVKDITKSEYNKYIYRMYRKG